MLPLFAPVREREREENGGCGPDYNSSSSLARLWRFPGTSVKQPCANLVTLLFLPSEEKRRERERPPRGKKKRKKKAA